MTTRNIEVDITEAGQLVELDVRGPVVNVRTNTTPWGPPADPDVAATAEEFAALALEIRTMHDVVPIEAHAFTTVLSEADEELQVVPLSAPVEYDPVTTQLVRMTDPLDRVYTYEYSEYGSLVKVNYPGNLSREYHYEMPGRGSLLTGITDERGVRYVTWRYDYQNRAIESTYAGGANRYTFSFGDKRTVVTDPYGASSTFLPDDYLRAHQTNSTISGLRSSARPTTTSLPRWPCWYWRVAASLAAGESAGMTITDGMPSSRADSAMACAWLPEENAITPARRCNGENCASAL